MAKSRTPRTGANKEANRAKRAATMGQKKTARRASRSTKKRAY